MSNTAVNKNKIFWVSEAGLIIALLVVVQLISFVVPKGVPIVSQLVTGTLVNLVLILSAGTAGFSATAIAAVISPLLALLFGQMSFPQMVPIIAAGNLVIVLITWLFFKNDGKFSNGKAFAFDLAGIIAGAAVKTLVLYFITVLLMVPVFFAALPKIGKNLTMMFSWPQLVTAILGGIIALFIIPRIRVFLKNRQ